jgi:hypothetical protein
MYSLTSDGTNLWLASYTDPAFSNMVGNDDYNGEVKSTFSTQGSGHVYKFDGSEWSSINSPFQDFGVENPISNAATSVDSNDFAKDVVRMGTDGLPRMTYLSSSVSGLTLNFVRCLDHDCITYNSQTFPNKVMYGASMVLDGSNNA